MLYSLTEKLNFNEDPQIQIKNKVLTVKSDAVTVLQLMDVLENEGQFQATLKAFDLLFSEKDQKAIKSLKLQFDDYAKLLGAAIDLALGENPDEEKTGE